MWHINTVRFTCFGLIGLLVTTPVWSQTQGGQQTNTDFAAHFERECRNNPKFTTDNFVLCDVMFPGGFGISENSRVIGIQPSGDGGSAGGIKGRPGQTTVGGVGSSTTAVSAGDEDFGLGLLATSLSGETERQGSELENGFESELSGYVAGLDFRFGDFLILGGLVGSVEDDLTVAGGSGVLKTESDSTTFYATLTPIENFSVDFYSGTVDSEINSQRNITMSDSMVELTGLITGSYQASQDIQGASINYDVYLGSWSLGGFIALDSVETETEGYAEEGRRTNSGAGDPPGSPQMGDPTGLELIYPDQKFESETESIGLRAAYNAQFDWGVLIPNIKIISVEEKENDARTIEVFFVTSQESLVPPELGFTDEPFIATTDDPDRKYMTSGFGVVAAFNMGLQIFLDYEQRSGHDFIDTSSITLGAIYGF